MPARHLLDGDLTLAAGGPAYELSRPAEDELAAALELLREQAARHAAMRLMATTIGVIATDATLTKAQCAKVAGIGHDGMARAISPVHTMFDGDTLFTLATGERGPVDPMGFFALLDAAGGVVTRAIVRGVLAAESVTTPGGSWPSYRDTFPSAVGDTGR
jgi:L-aminopeptidase/D-esterase-like protein